MLVYNLTDKSRPGYPARQPKTLVIGSQSVRPGGFVEVPDSLPRRDIAALIQDEMISISFLPQWYQAAQREPEVMMPPSRRRKKES